MTRIENVGAQPQKPRSAEQFKADVQGAIDSSSDMATGIEAIIEIYKEEKKDVPASMVKMLQDLRSGAITPPQLEEDSEEFMDEGLLDDESDDNGEEIDQSDDDDEIVDGVQLEETQQSKAKKIEEKPTIRLGGKSKMKRLSEKEIIDLNLPKIGSDQGQVLHPAHDDKDGKDFFILQRPDDAFTLDESHPLIQAAQLEVASTIINGIQSRSAVDRAGAIKTALKQHGFSFNGGPFDLLRFAVDAMDIVIEFEKRQSQIRMLDIHQAGLLQLQEDMSANIAQFYLLPPHRRMNVALLSQLFMVRDAEEIMTDQTVQKSADMRTINNNLEEMKKEARSAWMESAQEALSRTVKTTTGAAKQVITDIGGGITEVSGEALNRLQSFALGEESIDKGTVNALLDSMGNLGTKLRIGLKESGVDAVTFFKNMASGGKSSDSEELEDE